MKKFLSDFERIFKYLSGHDDNIITYTKGKDGVYDKHIDWKQIGIRLIFWIALLLIAVLVIELLFKAIVYVLAIMIVLYIVHFVFTVLNKQGSTKKGEK